MIADGASRICPNCRASEEIEANREVWPVCWSCKSCGKSLRKLDEIPSFAPDLADTIDGFDPTSFARLASIETGHYWFEPRNLLLTNLSRKFFPNAVRYLEIGCGTGFVLSGFARAYPNLEIVGSELHPTGLRHARKRLGLRASFVQMDARQIPARRAFDLIGSFDVLEHIMDDEVVLSEAYSALTKGGGIVLAVPQHPFLWSSADDFGHHVRRYRRGELEAKLRRAGFTVLWSTSYTALLFPLMALSRMSRRKASAEAVITSEFHTSKSVNVVLRTILYFEVKLSALGLRWPFGGSRIVVAVKPIAGSDVAA